MLKQKIKIAVAIDNKGNWHSAGWSRKNLDDESFILGIVQEDLEGERIELYWIETEISIPEIKVLDVEDVKITKVEE
jgi:hypothetical protein